MLTAAATQPPAALLEQLAVGGRMILPMTNQRDQHLVVIERTDRGHVERRMDSVKFVPLLPGIG
jgi:protein-L-isoaspartate(D-aspartate) O-methyltransferase